MTRQLPTMLGLMLCLILATDYARGQDGDERSPDINDKQVIQEQLSQTRHTAQIGGVEIAYTATVGRIRLKDDDDEDRAQIYYFAYVRDGVTDVRRRPITFSFNGGPGSSSVWLHLGLMGPKRVPMPDDASLPAPPYHLIANEHSLLDVTDIVMIDPVSTGVSRQTGDAEAKEFHGYGEDIRAVGDFVERFITTANRWSSPKFLLGESYGTTRAAGLAGELQERHGMYLSGIAMVSSVLNFQTIRFGDGNDLPYVLFLPGYTATAWYHERLDAELQRDLRKTLKEAERFATHRYAPALLEGDRMSARRRGEIVAGLSRYTGLSPDFVRRANLRIDMGRFAKELLRDERKTVGRLDSRYRGVDRDAAGAAYTYDPSSAALRGTYTALLNEYVRNDLRFELPRKYNISGSVRPWNYDPFNNRYLDNTDTLRDAISQNPALRVFVASGYYDLATPYFASDYTYHNLQLEPHLRGNVTFGYYEAGHMMYVHGPSLARLKADLAEFYRAAVPAEDPANAD